MMETGLEPSVDKLPKGAWRKGSQELQVEQNLLSFEHQAEALWKGNPTASQRVVRLEPFHTTDRPHWTKSNYNYLTWLDYDYENY